MDQVDEVKSKVDIVEVISSYIPLKKSGRNYAALCPFHSEKTPSFMVSPERQVFKCFGCQESGDVFTFLKKREGWEFREALEEMAHRAGVKLVATKPSAGSRIREKLIEVNNLTLKFYKYLLTKHKIGKSAREYLAGRGIEQAQWAQFDLGFAPGGWETLCQFLTKRGYALSDMATAGLVIGRDASGSVSPRRTPASRGGYYDRFRSRLMFPLKDGRGTVLGFAGRLLADSQKEAKYINSPETPIFTKGNLLFGLDVSRSAIRERGEAVLVEGEFDVLSSYKAGVVNVVASKGTALTLQQVALLSRICEKVIVSFDTDLAGDAAARRGIELLDNAGIAIRVAVLGKYKDPDQMAQADPTGFKKALESAVDVYDYFIDSAAKRYNPTTAQGKKKIGQEVLPILARISNDLVRAHYVNKLADVLELETATVEAAVAKSTGGGVSELVAEMSSPEPKISQEEYFLALLLSQKEILKDAIRLLAPADFSDEGAKRLYSAIGDIIKRLKTSETGKILAAIPKDLSRYIDELFLVDIAADFSEKDKWADELIKTLKMIRRQSLRRRLAQISKELSQAQGRDDEKQVATLLARFAKISEDMRQISL